MIKISVGTAVTITARKTELPTRAGMYSGQSGVVIEVKQVGRDIYYRVQFSNGDVVAYLGYEVRPNDKNTLIIKKSKRRSNWLYWRRR
jgi:hypothetical protein